MDTILHRIKAYLYENLLTEDPNDFIARVSSERSLSIRDVAGSAISRGGADIAVHVMEHAVDLFLTEMAYLLCDGYSVNTGWFIVSVHIKGVFNGPNDRFDPERHNIAFEFRQGDKLRKELSSVEIELMGVADTQLNITEVIDVKTGTVDSLITPNRNLRIRGVKLKIVGDNEANGVYFVNCTTHERTKVDPTDIVINNPSELMVVIPDLPAGTYALEVTGQFSGSSTPLKESKTCVFNKKLTVQLV